MVCHKSALTGESDAVQKSAHEPFIISGSQVVEGEGRMMVLAVGPRTEWGRLLALTTGELEATPLQDKLTGVAALVAKVGLSVAVACFLVLFIFLCVEVMCLRLYNPMLSGPFGPSETPQLSTFAGCC